MALAHRLLLHLGTRARIRGFFAVAAVLTGVGAPEPPEPTPTGLAALLGASVGGVVRVPDFAWESPRSLLTELFFGRRVLFLAAAREGGPKDVYRASVRLTPSGQPLAVAHVENLTDTPEADEVALGLRGDVATFVTVALGRLQALSVLELRGGHAQRADLFLDAPVREATLTRDARSLTLRPNGGDDELRYDFARRALAAEPGAAHVVVRERPRKRIGLRLADAAQGLLGVRLSGALGDGWLIAADLLQRAARAALPGTRPALRSLSASPVAAVVEARVARRLEEVWPPPAVPSLWATPEPDEARFVAVRPPFRKPPLDVDPKTGGDPCLYRTLVRPDPIRPYARVVLVAMDMRQLELGMQAGTELPRASAGPPGEGRLPNHGGALRRVVAVFNGGGAALGERFGMLAGGRLLVPPRARAASIAQTAAGETLLGPWPFDETILGEPVAFRQGLTPLLDTGGRALGSHSQGVPKRRTGLCATRAGHLYYAFGEYVSEATLGGAFAQAGCAYAVELANGVEPLGMALADVTRSDQARFALVDPAMDLEAELALTGSSRDFFYLTARDLRPRLPESATFEPDPGTQPLPEWLTGIFRAKVPLGALTVDLLGFESGRVEWRLRPGVREPGAKGEPWAGALPPGDPERALATLELGHTTVTPRLGLALAGTTPISLKDSFATLVLSPTEIPRILGLGEIPKLSPEDQAVQLPLLADADGVTERARDRGELRARSALGVTRSGRVVVAFLRHDSSDPLAVALRDAGCERVVELDRGSHHPALIERAGTPTPPSENHDTTTLWALARPMLPGARVGLE